MKLYRFASMLLVLFVLAPVLTLAQTPPPRTVTITVTGPTKYEDGSAIPAGKAMTFNTYVGTCGASKAKVGSGVGTESTAPNVSPGQCIAASALVDGVEGPLFEVVYHGKPGAVSVIIVRE